MTTDAHDGPQAGTAVEVAFSIDEPVYPFVSLSQRESCTVELVEMVARGEDRYAEFFHVAGANVDRVRDRFAAFDSTVQTATLSNSDGGGLVELVVNRDCPARRLAQEGALPRTVRGVDGCGRIVAEIPARCDHSRIVETFLADTEAASLERKRAIDSVRPPFSSVSFERIVADRLTDRQRAVIEAAYDAGYYDWPRGATGAEVADRLGITSATFSEHIHAAERKLLALLFESPT